MITQHHQPEGQSHHRIVVDLGPGALEVADPKTLRPLAEAEAIDRCVPTCFRRGAVARVIRVRDEEAIVYVEARS